MLKHLWWEDVKNDVKDIKLFMFAMASNPAWWIAFIETIRQQKEDELRNHKKSKRVIKFPCYCPFNKRFSKWYEFTKTDWVYTQYMKPCFVGLVAAGYRFFNVCGHERPPQQLYAGSK